MGVNELIMECQRTLKSFMFFSEFMPKGFATAYVGSAKAHPFPQQKRRKALQDLLAAQSATWREMPSPHWNRRRQRSNTPHLPIPEWASPKMPWMGAKQDFSIFSHFSFSHFWV